MRIATFNLESWGGDRFDPETLAPRIARVRPILSSLAADVLCLQEVNAQRAGGERGFAALDALVQGTEYAGFHRAHASPAEGRPSDRHNLVLLSRHPIARAHRIDQNLVSPPRWRAASAAGASPEASPEASPQASAGEVRFDRPILAAKIALPTGRILHVFCVHLRAPIAAPVAGQKLSAEVWKSVGGWAEGYFLASMKRVGQALELRLAIEAILDRDPDALVAAAGDFNAVEMESALRIVCADPDDTGNDALANRSMRPVEHLLEEPARFTVLHRGRPHMLDHILASPALAQRITAVDILNTGLADEVLDADTTAALGSFHAPVVATFDLDDPPSRER